MLFPQLTNASLRPPEKDKERVMHNYNPGKLNFAEGKHVF